MSLYTYIYPINNVMDKKTQFNTCVYLYMFIYVSQVLVLRHCSSSSDAFYDCTFYETWKTTEGYNDSQKETA